MARVPEYFNVPLGILIGRMIDQPIYSERHTMEEEINARFVLMDEARKEQVVHDLEEYEQAKRGKRR